MERSDFMDDADGAYNISADAYEAETADDFTDGEHDGADEELAGMVDRPDDHTLMRSADAAGSTIWPDVDDLVFLFSTRYNSPIFRTGYMQAEYRVSIQHSFTGLVDGIIDRKLEQYRSNPFMYRKYAKKLEAANMQADRVVARASLFGIDLSRLDVGFLVHDVVESLERLTDSLLDDHPDLTEGGALYARRFLHWQLADRREQMLWRFVTSGMFAKLYEYRSIGEAIPLIRGLDGMIRQQFPLPDPDGDGMHAKDGMPCRDPAHSDISDILSDGVIDECRDLLDGEYHGMPADWAVSAAIASVEDPDPGW